MPRRSPHYIVFGAGDRHNKAIVIGKSQLMGGYECNIIWLKDDKKYEAGETVDIEDFSAIESTLYFTRLDSMKAFLNAMNEAIKKWEGET